MSISVIIVTYNEEKTIKDCLDSIFKQTKKPDEIILVDDGSTDKTLETASQYKIKILKTLHKERSHARNYGWKRATGDIILFAEADSVFDKNWIAEIMKQFDKGADAAIDRRKMYQPKNYIQKCLDTQFDVRYADYQPFSAWAFKKGVLEKVGGFDQKLNQSEDSDLGKRILQKGYKILLAKDALQYHRGEPQNLFQYLKRAFISEKRKAEGYYQKYSKEKPKGKLLNIFIIVFFITISLINWHALLILYGYLAIQYLYLLIKIAFKEKGIKIVKFKYILGLSFYRLLRNLFAAGGYIAGHL